MGFAPTRLNTADDPTRDADLRESCDSSCISHLQPNVVQKLHALQVSRPTAGWIRLVLLLGFLPVSDASVSDHLAQCGLLHPYLCGFCSAWCLFVTAFVSFWILTVTAILLILGISSFCHFGLRMLPTVSAEPDYTPKTPQRGLNPRGLGESSPSSEAIASSPFSHRELVVQCFKLELLLIGSVLSGGLGHSFLLTEFCDRRRETGGMFF